MAQGNPRLVVVSNRLPFQITRSADGGYDVIPGSGGLVTALLPVLRNRGGVWVGWPGLDATAPDLEAALGKVAPQAGYTLRPVPLSAEEVESSRTAC